MRSKTPIYNIIILGIIILALDYAYLGLVLRDPFLKMVKKIQKKGANETVNVKREYAVVVYCLMIGALYYFIIREGKTSKSAFILGFVIYGVFDFTNIAIFDNYSLLLALHDTVWGGTLFFLTTVIYRYFVDKK